MRVEAPARPFPPARAVKPVLDKARFSLTKADSIESVASRACRGEASRAWSIEGRLGPSELTVKFEQRVHGGIARFNVRDAGGYRGARKCNLFALEIAQRAGFLVPVTGRRHGVGFPGADTIARAAGRGQVSDWAVVTDRTSLSTLAEMRASGACLLLAGAAPGLAPGHVVVIDRVLDVQRDAHGGIASVRYLGWEAGADGSRYGEGTMTAATRGGRFDEIHLLSPFPASRATVVLERGAAPGPSRLDLARV